MTESGRIKDEEDEDSLMNRNVMQSTSVIINMELQSIIRYRTCRLRSHLTQLPRICS